MKFTLTPKWSICIFRSSPQLQEYKTGVELCNIMKTSLSVVISLLVIFFLTEDVESQCAASKDKSGCYSERYDNVNVDAVLQSSRLLKRYVDCLLDKGKCTSEGQFLKELIPDVMLTECSKCNAYQKKTAGKLLGFMLQNRRDWFDLVINKYDKDGMFRKKYEIDDEDYEDENGS